MKAKSITIVSVLFMSFLLLTSIKALQDTETFEGTFDGKEDYGYNFIGIDEDGDEYTMTFHQVDAKALEAYNLDSDDLIGTKFTVTYKTKKETIKDEDGYEEDIETLIIIGLTKL
ncbi:MAG: hypothetical protein R2816_01205 [Flavobacteriaceae bacterium]|jgi:hypothetical protein|nr:hypothetical protein [Flavobacteriaceae bacterium]